MGTEGCYQPIELTPVGETDVPWVHCVLNSDDSIQQLRLYSLSSSNRKPVGINDADISLYVTQNGSDLSLDIPFRNTGDGIWQFDAGETDFNIFKHGTDVSLRIRLSDGRDITSEAVSIGTLTRPSLVPSETQIPRFSIFESPAIWVYRLHGSEVSDGLKIEEQIATDREDLTDAFNRESEIWHRRYLRFLDGRVNRYAYSADIHSNTINPSFIQDTISLFGRNELEDSRFIVFKYVTRGYDLYLKDVAQYELLHSVSTDIIGVYDNKNCYSNIIGGVGIFGAETISAYDIQDKTWHYGDLSP